MKIILLFLSIIKKRNASWKVKFLNGLLFDKEKILDFGCGDLTFASMIKKQYPNSQVTGVDVITIKKIPQNVSFICYNGDKMPFATNAFDTVISFYVFHHCKDAKISLNECLRVAKKRVVIIEAVPRNKYEVLPMKIMDFLYNLWKLDGISYANQFFIVDDWEKMIIEAGGIVKKIEERKTIFSFIPIGKTIIFEIGKR